MAGAAMLISNEQSAPHPPTVQRAASDFDEAAIDGIAQTALHDLGVLHGPASDLALDPASRPQPSYFSSYTQPGRWKAARTSVGCIGITVGSEDIGASVRLIWRSAEANESETPLAIAGFGREARATPRRPFRGSGPGGDQRPAGRRPLVFHE